MKPFIEKFFTKTSRFEWLFLTVPFILWVFCFRQFFNGHLRLEADAISYADHINFYIDNLRHGVFPLWDPAWYSGAPNDFFLRRIGDVNPLLFGIVLLKSIGVPSAIAYLAFLGFYYFLAGWAFYLIARMLFAERFFAYSAYILFLFSSWGCELFYNYIIIIFVPLIWFFFFLLSFARTPRRSFLLGLSFCVGLIVTTYIPFFFLTILFIFAVLSILFYQRELIAFLKSCAIFLKKHVIFSVLCLAFMLASCVPALVFYKESKGGEFVLPNRHTGADIPSALAVGLDNVSSGDIISHGYFDRIFDDHAHLDLADIYLPYLFFLILLVTVAARVNKLIFFLLFNILALGLITVTSAAGVHLFLYQHIIIFKFIRNIYYFFWLAMLPMAVLLSIAALKSLLAALDASSRKGLWLWYIVGCHGVFALFLLGHKGVLWGAWGAIIVSLSYFITYCVADKKTSYLAGFVLLLLAVFMQSAEVYQHQARELYFTQQAPVEQKHEKDSVKAKMSLYYVAKWFGILVNFIDPQVLDNYVSHRFILYDNVVPYVDSPDFLKTFQAVVTDNTNVAFIPKADSTSSDWASPLGSAPRADLDALSSGELTLEYTDANTWVLTSHLPAKRFLVINDNYNSDWHATINGQKASLFRANVAFKGLWVPSGDAHIVLRFATPLRYGFHLGLMAVFAVVFIMLIVFIKRRL